MMNLTNNGLLFCYICGKEVDGYYLAYNRKPYDIHVIQNLSRAGFTGVLAHEVLHLWQYNYDLNTPSLLCEGMCELYSYLY